jgi:recombination protein RecA
MQRAKQKLSQQIKEKVSAPPPEKKPEYDGDFGTIISTGSTLLDLAISGGRVHGGGLPGGIFVEVFGPSSSGKSVLLSEIAGAVQRQGGEIIFADPESRLNAQFASMFGLEIKEGNYSTPNTVTEIFQTLRKWKPEKTNVINGIFADSLAALSTDLEMDNDDGDPFGSRRAKEFSEQLRKTCREIKEKNYLMVASNQVRDVIGATQYQAKTKSTGGKALEFYPSLRLQFANPKEIKRTEKIAGKEVTRVIEIETPIRIFKNSVWEAYRTATITINFKYGIDNIKDSLQFIKDYTTNTVYCLGEQKLSNSMAEAIKIIEDSNAENELREEVITLWEYIEQQFTTERKPKIR